MDDFLPVMGQTQYGEIIEITEKVFHKDSCVEYVVSSPKFSYKKWLMLTAVFNCAGFLLNLHSQVISMHVSPKSFVSVNSRCTAHWFGATFRKQTIITNSLFLQDSILMSIVAGCLLLILIFKWHMKVKQGEMLNQGKHRFCGNLTCWSREIRCVLCFPESLLVMTSLGVQLTTTFATGRTTSTFFDVAEVKDIIVNEGITMVRKKLPTRTNPDLCAPHSRPENFLNISWFWHSWLPATKRTGVAFVAYFCGPKQPSWVGFRG